MAEYSISVEKITSWFRSKERVLEAAGVILAGIRERQGTNKPAAFADYDTDVAMGRIIVWVSGEVDFHLINKSSGDDVLYRHLHVKKLAEPVLESAFNDFLASMAHPKSTISN